jgi:glycosyltransferase involved in cell wall biosynthesis
MRLLVLNYEYPPIGGGAGNATYYLCREWGALGHTVDVITTWFKGLEEVSAGPNNVTVFRIKSMRRRLDRSNPLEMMSYIRHALKKARLLVKSHSYETAVTFFAIPTGVISYCLFKKYALPYILLLRGGDVPGFLHRELGLFHAITIPFTMAIWRNAARIIANSKSLQQLAHTTAQRLHRLVEMVPNGVDAEFFTPAYHLQNACFSFIFSGRFVSQKNLFFLICQFEKLSASRPSTLILVGDGPEKPTLEKKIKSSERLSNLVRLHPWSSKEQLRAFYQSAHCFINPSFEEGMPNTVLEAMACGLPVIASDIGGNNELIKNGKNGLLFTMNVIDDLKIKMQEILSLLETKSMGAYSRRIVSDHFSWNTSASRIISPLERVKIDVAPSNNELTRLRADK